MNLRYEIPQSAEAIQNDIERLSLPRDWFLDLDHIAIKAANSDHYDTLIKQLKTNVLLRPFSTEVRRIIQAEMQGRRIVIAKLAGRMAVGSWQISHFEIIQPRAEMVRKFKAGVDHFEYLSPRPLIDVEKQLAQVYGILPAREPKSRHDTICFNLGTNKIEVKLSDRPIGDVLDDEIMNREAEIIYEDS